MGVARPSSHLYASLYLHLPVEPPTAGSLGVGEEVEMLLVHQPQPVGHTAGRSCYPGEGAHLWSGGQEGEGNFGRQKIFANSQKLRFSP